MSKLLPVARPFWHCYDHPDRLPDPDGATALAAPLAAFPSWFIEATCAACRRTTMEGQVHLIIADEAAAWRPVWQAIAGMRCRHCRSDRFAATQLVTGHSGVHRNVRTIPLPVSS